MKMIKFNLHTHSKYSLDGKLDTNEIINEGFKKEISYLSITDHNTCDAYLDLDINKIEGSGIIIYGMEADALINNVTYDILCYGFDVNKVNAWAKEQYGTVESRQTKIYKKLEELCETLGIKLDTSITFNPKEEYAHAAIFRMFEAAAENKEFLQKYNINNVNDLYRASTMDTKFPLYIDMSIVWPTIEKLGEVIHENGGKIFLAHPYKYTKNSNIEELLNSSAPYIDGIEIYNELKSFEEVEYLYNYAKKNKLLMSVGSDFHGNEKHNKLEVDYLQKNMQKDIENWIDKVKGKIEIN